MKERTLLLIKPDAYKRKLIGAIIGRMEKEGFDITSISLKYLSRTEAETLYDIHKDRDFFDPLILFMLEAPVVALMLKREDAVRYLREMVGTTDPKEAKPGTIRAIYGTDTRHNVVHALDSKERFEEEAKIFFPDFITTKNVKCSGNLQVSI